MTIKDMEQVILVDDNNKPIGLAEKATVHTKKTPLHRAFSLFLFNSKGELLLTQRALSKKTFSGVWTNTVCGHLAPGETAEEAAQRRLKEELRIILCHSDRPRCHIGGVEESSEARAASGLDLSTSLEMTFNTIKKVSDYRYRFADKSGIVENEICPILVGYYDGAVKPNPLEIEDYKWMKWEKWLLEIETNPGQYSPWSVEEGIILKKILKI